MGLFDFLFPKKKGIDKDNSKMEDVFSEQVEVYSNVLNNLEEKSNVEKDSTFSDKISEVDVFEKNVVLEDDNIKKKDLPINSVIDDKIEQFCQNNFIERSSLSSRLLQIFDRSPQFLDFVSHNSIDRNIIDKINHGILKLEDIPPYSLELLNFPIFDEETIKKLEPLNKEITLNNDDYVTIKVDDIQEKYLPTTPFKQTTPSYFEGIDIVLDTKNVLPVNINSFDFFDGISILIPTKNKEIIINDFFNKYLVGDITLDKDTIVILPYENYLQLTDIEHQILSNCKIILREQFNEINKLSFEFSQKYNNITPSPSLHSKNNIIKLNHLLYVLDNSNLSEQRQKYYSYYFKEYYHKMCDGDWWSFQNLDELIKEFTCEIKEVDIKDITDKFNLLEKNLKEKEINHEAFSVDIFIKNIKDFEDINIQTLLYQINKLGSANRNLVLNDDKISKKFRESILRDSSNDTWRYFRTLLQDLSIEEFFNVLDYSCLKRFLDNNSKGYILFASACEKDLNKTIEIILRDDYLFDEFFKRSSSFFSILYNMDFELAKQIIYKIEKGGLKYSNDFISKISEKNQYELLKEPFNDNTLVWILHACYDSVLTFFFQNDERAKYLYHKFDMIGLARRGVKFGSEFIQKPEFFENLKRESLISFRNNINTIESSNPSNFLIDKVKAYYEEMLKNFDKDSEIFSQYKVILDNPRALSKVDSSNNYIFDYNIYFKIHKYIIHDYDTGDVTFGNNIDTVYQILKDETSKKLSEIIIDYLFQDNIYNIWLNIKEMLRYNKGLDKDNKILDSEKIEFYELILNFDKLSNSDKISFFEKIKDRNVNLIFYQDLRNVKDICYKNMKNDIIKLDEHPDFRDTDKSHEYGVDVYDLCDKEYTMLIKCIGSNFNEEVWGRRNCYSLISNENTSVFFDNGFIYGYEDFDEDHVLHVFEGDSFSGDTRDRENNDTGSNFVNRIASSRDIVNSRELTSYSEIQIVNKKNPNDKVFNALRPSYIVVFDKITSKSVNESKRLGIPIVIIKHKVLDYNMEQALNCERDMDSYMFDNLYEERHRKNR